MLPLASFVAALAATALGWALMVVIPATVFIGLPGSFFTPPGDTTLIQWIALTSTYLGLGVLLIRYTILRLCPASLRVHRLFPGAVKLNPWLWIAPGQVLQAYAVTGLGRGAVVLSELITHLPEDERRWVIEHERSHLVRGDAAATLWWRSGAATLNTALSLARILHSVTRPLPLLGRLGHGYYRAADLSLRLSMALFRVFDRHIGRQMEYRADRDAANATSPLAGARLLQRLSHSLEPRFDLFATHPPTVRRIDRLHALARTHEG
mgnify:CR=1 FL=1